VKHFYVKFSDRFLRYRAVKQTNKRR